MKFRGELDWGEQNICLNNVLHVKYMYNIK